MTTLSMLFSSLFSTGRKYLYSVFVASLLLIGQAFLNVPPEITPEIRRVLNTMAPYFTAGYDRLTPHLENIGFAPPNREEMIKWPVLRQLDYAYQASVDGEKFLALLAQSLAQEYGSIKEDPNIRPYFDVSVHKSKVSFDFVKPQQPTVKIPLKVMKCLTSMGGYLDGGALGGTTGILKHILKLPDEKIYEFQRESNSPIEAISRGLQLASKNQAQMKAYVSDIALQLVNNYESARRVPEITDALAWKKNKTKEILEWNSIRIDPQKNPYTGKGFNIDKLTTLIYQDSTKLGIEIVPDIGLLSVKIIISPAFIQKKTPPGFYSSNIAKLINLSGADKLKQIYIIEKEMRSVLSTSTEITPDPYDFFRAQSVPVMNNQEKGTESLTSDQIWQSFRNRFPFHIQTIGQSPRQPDSTYFILISEPPPHTTTKSIEEQFNGHVVSLGERKNQLGYDGWTKDVILKVKPADDAEMDTFYRKLYRHLFFIEPKEKPLDLSVQDAPVYFSKQNLNYEIHSVYLEKWLLDDKALDLIPLNNQNSAPLTLSQIFEKKQTGLWVTQNPVLVAWVLPFRTNLVGKEAEVREFAESIDFIIGAIRIEDNVAIIAHRRTVPEAVLPTMRTETILALAAAPYNGLAQSYERNFLWAGKDKSNLDWAPIYLSASLQNTDFGSLLNIADQMLKSWSLNGTIEYKNFSHQNPASWAFSGPLDLVLGTSSITFNGNMNGVTQLFEFSNHPKFKKPTIINVSRTGAMSITYESKDIHPDSVQLYEEKAWKYFSELGSPIWAQNVRYAALFQLFKNFEIQAIPEHANPLELSSLQNKTYNFLATLDSLDKPGVQTLVLKCVHPEHPDKLCEEEKLFRLLIRIKNKIADIKKESDKDAMQTIAQLTCNPRDLIDNPTNLFIEEMKGIKAEFEQLKNFPKLFDLLGFDFGQIMENYSRQNEQKSGRWIKTPVVVASEGNNLRGFFTGGHNVSTSSLSFRVRETSEIAEFHTNRYTKNGIIISVPEPIYARLTPELIRRFEKAIESGDRESIKKNLRAIY